MSGTTGTSRQHVVALYRTDAFLASEVARFVVDRAADGRGAVLVTSPDTWAAIRREMQRLGSFVAADLRDDRIVVLDATETLAAILDQGGPSAASLARRLGPAIARVRCATARPEVVAYGDMVNLLWERGDAAVALELERAWHAYIDGEPIDLLCGYRADPLHPSVREGLLPLCCAHVGVHASEDGARRDVVVRRAIDESEEVIGSVVPPAPGLEGGPEELAILALYDTRPQLAERIASRARSLLAEAAVAPLSPDDGSDGSAGLLFGILANAPMALQVFDPSGRSSFVNERYERLFGAAPTADYVVFDDPAAIACGHVAAIRRAFDGETLDLGAAWLGLPAGSVRSPAVSRTLWPLFDAAARISHVAVAYRDVSHEVRAREDLARRERRFRALVENGADVISVRDPDGEITWMSGSCDRVLGRGPDWFVGRRFADLVHADDQPLAAAMTAEVLAAPGRVAKGRYRVRHADGRWRWIAATVTNGIDDPDLGGLVLNEQDITEQIDAEDRLRTAQKLDAVGRLAGGIAHDFNNLLSVVSGFGYLAAQRAERGSDVTQELRTILDAAARASALTQQLLAFGRRGVRNPQHIDLAELVSGLLPLLGRAVGAAVRIDLDVQGAPIVRADKSHLEQVMMNLAVNARDAMPSGGQLSIAVHVDAGQGVLRVADTGVGIAPDVKARLFEPFFTTKPNGHGLGLATVFGIVEECGGAVEVASEPGEGTTFEVRLPLAAVASASPTSPLRSWSALVGVETVLVAEDEPGVRSYVAQVLSEAGYRVYVARDAQEAERIASTLDGPLHALVTDVVMPGASGPQLAHALRRRHLGLGVVYLSGFADGGELVSELEGGARFLQKPVLPPELLGTLRGVLDAARPAMPAATGP